MNDQIKYIYFLGIGGIGMSALARYYQSLGYDVSGYDRTSTTLTRELESSGISVHYEENLEAIPTDNKEEILVIYTPAIPKNNQEFQYLETNKFTMIKRSEALGLITRDSFGMAVAGTHGKTTTSTILGHIMHQSNKHATAFLGGISSNYNSNLLLGTGNITVMEADEFDRSFLRLRPKMAILTSMDADHLDIYGDEEGIIEGFNQFVDLIENKEWMLTRKGLAIQHKTYASVEEADYYVPEYYIENGKYIFTLKTPQGIYENLECYLPGHHNLENTVAACALALLADVTIEEIREALKTFKGIKRRFSKQVMNGKKTYIDDYAHHPTEINALHQAVREMFPNQKILIVFQPHLYSRTKDFVDGFADALNAFDEIILLPIYPARELPIEGVTSEWLLDKIHNPNKSLVAKSEVLNTLQSRDFDVLLTVGAGDIDTLVEPLTKWLSDE